MRHWINIIKEGLEPRYLYVTKCSDGGHGPYGEAINDMVDNEEDISYDEFIEAVGIDQMKEVFSQYDWDDDGGMTMKGDYTMKNAFHRSKWFGIPCVFCVWSAIEFVFTENGETPESLGIDRDDYIYGLD